MNIRQIAALTVACIALALPASGASSGWYSSYSKAKAAAKRDGRPLLTIVVHEGCPECARMDSALASSRARNALRNAVKCRVEFMSNPQLVNSLGVTLTPTLIVYSHSHGGEVYRSVGAMSVSGIADVGRSIDSLVTRSGDDDEREDKPVAKKTKSQSSSGSSKPKSP
jgi:hypothetical protein